MHTAEFCVDYRSPRAAAIVADAVGQEIREIDGDRSKAALSRRGDELRIEITADDLVALRAGINTWGTLVEVAERTAESAVGESL